MDADRRARAFLRLFGDGDGDGPGTAQRLCVACAEATGLTGAGISLLGDGGPLAAICTSDPVSARLEDLQVLLGAGPCIDAWAGGEPVLVPDLRSPAADRWIGFAAGALEAGAAAVFGFPLQVGGVRLGALNLHRDRAGELTADQHADALAVADAAAHALLAMQGRAPVGGLAPALDAGWSAQAVVHQASGMVAAQLGTTVDDALLRLRAHAFGHDRTLADVAHDVVARQLRFSTDGGGDAAG